jgi:heme-degrading monooxygenase HmoA
VFIVESRFRVANAMEDAVRAAFIARPRFVDNVAGFLGMEVCTREGDPAEFHLVTRWTDRASYETWHRGDLHRASHAFIPRGLKLDAAYTQVTMMRGLDAPPVTPADELRAALDDSASRIAAWMAEASSTYAMFIDAGGAVVLNAALARRLGRDASSRLNATAVVAANDAAALADRIGTARTETRAIRPPRPPPRRRSPRTALPGAPRCFRRDSDTPDLRGRSPRGA